jgi:hypothetical protein
MTELEVSLTFVQIAANYESLGDETEARRRRSIAEQGLESARKYACHYQTNLTAEQKYRLVERINLIELLLE